MGYRDDFEAADKAGKTERLSFAKLPFKEGDQVVGRYLSRELVESNKKGYADSYCYTFDTDEGPATVFFSNSFDEKIGEDLISGDVYMIHYVKKVNIGGSKTWKQIDVFRLPADPKDPLEAVATDLQTDSD